jgi:anti-sigma regulatory factor (Ser/Thr protein kinase)
VPAADAVVIDFQHCAFLAPWSLGLFGAYGLWLHEELRKSVTIEIDPNTAAGRYLEESGFCQLFGDTEPPPLDKHDFRVCLQRIRDSAGIAPFAKSVAQMLHIEDEDVTGAISYALVELLRNVVQHSRSSIGGLAMAQYFPRSGLVELVVVDRGIGVQAHISQTYRDIQTDMQAIDLAVLPHHSGTFGQGMYGAMKDNAGLGLFFVNEIAIRGGGSFAIGSGTALLERWSSHDWKRKSRRSINVKGHWDGTFAVVQLRRGDIADFDGLLDVCRSLAASARDDPYIQALEYVDDLPDQDENLMAVRVSDFLENVEEAARIRDEIVIPSLEMHRSVVLDFDNITVITQSFAHALFHKILRAQMHVRYDLQLCRCSDAVRAAITAVASYAKSPNKNS